MKRVCVNWLDEQGISTIRKALRLFNHPTTALLDLPHLFITAGGRKRLPRFYSSDSTRIESVKRISTQNDLGPCHVLQMCYVSHREELIQCIALHSPSLGVMPLEEAPWCIVGTTGAGRSPRR
jgi:hypothetical protein